MSSARPCGRPSTMSIITTWSARSFSAIRRAVLEPTFPAPTTVTFAIHPNLSRPLDAGSTVSLFHELYHCVGDLGGAHRARIIAVGFHVVGDACPFGYHRGDRGLEPVGRLHLLQVLEHHYTGQHHGHWIDLVLARVLGGRAVGRLEHRRLVADVS